MNLRKKQNHIMHRIMRLQKNTYLKTGSDQHYIYRWTVNHFGNSRLFLNNPELVGTLKNYENIIDRF